LLRIPAIQLGDLRKTLRLPNVTHHSDMSTLSRCIRQVTTLDMNTPDYERRMVNYVAAAYDSGFTTDHHRAWEQGKSDDLPDIYSLFRDELVRCLVQSSQRAGATSNG